jgi:hypothetical protein
LPFADWPIVVCRLSFCRLRLPIADLSIIDCRFVVCPIADYRLPIAVCRLSIAVSRFIDDRLVYKKRARAEARARVCEVATA